MARSFLLLALLTACGSNGGGGIDGPPGDGLGPGIDAEVKCGEVLATLRDFQDTHPDMEFAPYKAQDGIVEDTLGPNGKPVYAHAGPLAEVVPGGQGSFDQWYSDTPGVNMTFQQPFALTEENPGQFVFEDNSFFPLTGLGFGEEGRAENFHFTTEIHGAFDYKGGEVFTFTGDDDVFVFVNGKLAIDLGGIHSVLEETIDFDAEAANLGISVGNRYTLDVFHAERHTSESNFRIETSIDCLSVVVQ